MAVCDLSSDSLAFPRGASLQSAFVLRLGIGVSKFGRHFKGLPKERVFDRLISKGRKETKCLTRR